MAYRVDPEPGEKVEAEVKVNLSRKTRPFFFAVSSRAIYIPRIKLIAKSDPYYFQRVPLDQILEVTVSRLRPYALWLMAVLMIPIGLVTTIQMMEPLLRHEPGTHTISGWPISLFVCGFLVPFVARGRFGLKVQFRDGKYRWKPPLVVDQASRQEIADTLQSIVEACGRVGVRVSDERSG
jgi:hypothetical protein